MRGSFSNVGGSRAGTARRKGQKVGSLAVRTGLRSGGIDTANGNRRVLRLGKPRLVASNSGEAPRKRSNSKLARLEGVLAVDGKGRIAFPRKGQTLESLFELQFAAKVDRSAGPDGCWPWTGKTMGGYGAFLFRRRYYRVHRLSLEMSLGRELTGIACHRCDNPPCVNPAHLYEATQAENMADMVAKGRHSFGERNGHSKLTVHAVRRIRAEYQFGNGAELAAEFGVAESTVLKVVKGERWTRALAEAAR